MHISHLSTAQIFTPTRQSYFTARQHTLEAMRQKHSRQKAGSEQQGDLFFFFPHTGSNTTITKYIYFMLRCQVQQAGYHPLISESSIDLLSKLNPGSPVNIVVCYRGTSFVCSSFSTYNCCQPQEMTNVTWNSGIPFFVVVEH